MERAGGFSDQHHLHPGSKVSGNGLLINGKNNNRSDTCRDFLRNVCSRGAKCKYVHPGNKEDVSVAMEKADYGGDFSKDAKDNKKLQVR